MWTVSQTFVNTLTQDHVPYVTFQVYAPNNDDPIFTYDPAHESASTNSLRVTDGSVAFDKQSSSRSRLSNLTIVDPSFVLTPADTGDIFSAYGNEIVVNRGLLFADGTAEVVPLGRFRITSSQAQDKDGALTIQLNGFDRSWIVGGNVFISYWPDTTLTPIFPFRGAPYATYLRAMLRYAFPAIEFDADDAAWADRQNDTAGGIIDPNNYTSFFMNPGDSPWSKAQELAKTVGCALYFDRIGVCHFQTDPSFVYMSAETQPPFVAAFEEGETSTFTEVSRTLDSEKTYNRVFVTGEGTVNNQPLWSIPAEDNDPDSPTNINGPFGVRTKVVSNAYAVTHAMVNSYAQLLLRTTIGRQRSVQFAGAVYPHLDVDDVVSITRARSGLDDTRMVIDNITVPLRADQTMSATLREVRALQ